MTDETNTPNPDTTPEEVVVSPVEQEAREAGWVPKEEYLKRDGADEHKWVDAGEFVRRGELIKRIENQGKQLKDVRLALNEMKKLHSQVRETTYKEALASLREQKKQALIDGDADAVISAEERIDLVKEQVAEFKAEPQTLSDDPPQEHPEFVQWKEQNSWYNSSAPMKAFADTLGRQLAAAGNNPSDVLKKVAIEVRKEFPNRFNNPNRDKPGAVEGGRGGSSNKSTFTLTDEERRIMHTLVRAKAFDSEKDYIEAYKKANGIKG